MKNDLKAYRNIQTENFFFLSETMKKTEREKKYMDYHVDAKWNIPFVVTPQGIAFLSAKIEKSIAPNSADAAIPLVYDMLPHQQRSHEKFTIQQQFSFIIMFICVSVDVCI